jgi:3-oxoacyl-[acyl-carrier protein] reductase
VKLEGRTALVTGGSRGLGASIAIELAREGAYVVVGYTKNEKEAAAVAEGRGEIARIDVTDAASVDETVRRIVDTRGIDVLVCSAGVNRDQLFAMASAKDWQEEIDVNLVGAMRSARAVARPMMAKGRGSIVFLGSIAGSRASMGQAGYSASKGGLLAFARTLAVELAPKNVRANVVVPGLIDAGMVKRMDRRQRDLRAQHIPMQRLGIADEVARAVVFFASDDSSYITGQALVVDGGLSA